MGRTQSRIATESVLDELVDSECSWCATGTLARGEFKDEDAVICENCGTPAVRVW